VNYSASNSTLRVQAGDLDGDGKPEIVTANYGLNSIYIYRNRIAESVPALPTITSFSPTSGGQGAQVTITGTNLSQATSVSFGSVTASFFTVTSPTTIIATVGAGASGSVSVTTPGGTASLEGFTFNSGPPAPTISSFTPTSGGTGATITITGTNFTGATAVSFGAVPASSFIVINANTISAVVGAGASGNVSVTTPAGSGSLPGFIYNVVTGIGGPGSINSKELLVNPNPGAGQIIIYHPMTPKISEIKFVDVLGRPVKKITPLKNSTKTEAEVSTLSPGMYVITWSDGTRLLTRTFLRQ
jgi:hypothetical protein